VYKIQKLKLNNGLTVIVKKLTSETVSVRLSVKVGTCNETEADTGINHLLEHVIFGKSRRFKFQHVYALERRCQELNAENDLIDTDYYAEEFFPEVLNQALDVLSGLIFGAMITNEDIEREKQIILREIGRIHDNVMDVDSDCYLKDMLTKTLFSKHPMRFSIAGEKEVVENIKRSDLWDFYKKFYMPNNMVLAVAGNIDENEVISKVKKTFGRYESRELPKVNRIIEPQLNGSREAVEERDVAQAYILTGVRIPASKKLREVCIQDLIKDILAGGSYGRLYHEIRQKRGLAYDVTVDIINTNDYSCLLLYSESPVERIQEVKGILVSDLRKLVTEEITEEELRAAQQTLNEGYRRELQLDSFVASTFCNYENRLFGAEQFEKYPEELATITAPELLKTAKGWISPDDYVSVRISPRNRKK